jgi:hypothetical protein
MMCFRNVMPKALSLCQRRLRYAKGAYVMPKALTLCVLRFSSQNVRKSLGYDYRITIYCLYDYLFNGLII